MRVLVLVGMMVVLSGCDNHVDDLPKSDPNTMNQFHPNHRSHSLRGIKSSDFNEITWDELEAYMAKIDNLEDRVIVLEANESK